MRLLLIWFVTFFYFTNGADCQLNPVRIKASVISAESGEKLAYANVFNRNTLLGTATNLDGYFELPGNSLLDTVVISYIGYDDLELVLSTSFPKSIKLSPNQSLIDEIVITAESDYLYDILKDAINNTKTESRESKTYYFLETFLFEEPVEIIEAYYNGRFADHAMQELNVKKGRIGLKSVNNRYYATTESSKLFSTYNAFKRSNFFPTSPLALNKRNLKKQFKLYLKKRFKEKDSEICLIAFSPRDKNRSSFRGTIWVDITNNQILKLEYNLQDAEKHPFEVIGYNVIEKVDMQISKSFIKLGKEYFINSIDFNYNIEYQDTIGNKMKAVTRAFIKAFDYDRMFTLPFFEFTRHRHQDYRNLIATEYDDHFWNNNHEFKFYDRKEQVESFINENKIENNLLYPTQKSGRKHQLQFPYIPWDSTRFKMNQASSEVIEKSQRNIAFESQRSNFNIKMYLDVNNIGDSLAFQISTFLDPVGSFYHFPISSIDLAYMNILFDLMEIQKRKLATFITDSNLTSIAEIEKAYWNHIDAFNTISQVYKSEVDRGRNFPKLKKWNQQVIDNLGINNIKFHGLTEDEKSNTN